MTLRYETEVADLRGRLPRLTGRERYIARLIAEDLSNREIADRLFVSARTVENHISNIFAKLGTNTRTGVARWVHDQHGWAVESSQDEFPGDDLKPDPLAVRTDAQLEDLLRKFWIWAGYPSCRKIAARSGGAFSHTTISKLLNDRPGKPPLKLEYVRGLVRGCGGDTRDEQRWATAWRRIHLRGGV